VRRKGEFNAPYVTIAAAKPFSGVVSEYLSKQSRPIKNAHFNFFTKGSLSKTRQLLERYLNNTEPEHFFLPRAGNEKLPEDLLVHLRLSIALRKDHYDVLARSKIAELQDIFQAKLGWLKGNIYSRVATPDIEEQGENAAEFKSRFYDEYIPSGRIVSLSQLQADRLRELVAAKHKHLARELTSEEVLELVREQVTTDIDILASKIVERMVRSKVIDAGDKDRLRLAKSAVMNEPTVKSLLARD
jgi:hypothetical protein